MARTVPLLAAHSLLRPQAAIEGIRDGAIGGTSLLPLAP